MWSRQPPQAESPSGHWTRRSHCDPNPTDRPAPHGRVGDWLDDFAGFGADADYLVGLGKEAYLVDTAQGRLLRNAGEERSSSAEQAVVSRE